MRFAIAIIAALVVACGHPTDHRPIDPAHAGTRPADPPKSTGATRPPASGVAASPAPIVLPVVGCPTPSCAFHAGAGAYFTCLSGGAGACFHFGAPCTPADACMFDPADRTYKQCAKSSEGTCQQWAAACAPTTRCMFAAADGLYHACDELAGGTCKHYGALCAP